MPSNCMVCGEEGCELCQKWHDGLCYACAERLAIKCESGKGERLALQEMRAELEARNDRENS